MSLEEHNISCDGIVKVIIGDREIYFKNTWQRDTGLRRIANLLAGQTGTSLESTLYAPAFKEELTQVHQYCYENLSKSIDSNVLCSSGEYSCGTSETLVVSTLYLSAIWNNNPASNYEFWSVVALSPFLTIPPEFKFRIEWRTTFNSADYTSTCLNSIASRLCSIPTNSDFPPTTIRLIHQTGTLDVPIIETKHTFDTSNRIVIFRSDTITTGSYNFGTIELWRNFKYASKVVSFSKPSEAKIQIDWETTISA